MSPIAAGVIALLGIIVTVLLALVGWLAHSLAEVRSDLAALVTDMAVVRRELTPPGAPSLSERVGTSEINIAVLAAAVGRTTRKVAQL